MAHLVHANALVLLSDVEALYTTNPAKPEARKISEVWNEADLADVDIETRGTASAPAEWSPRSTRRGLPPRPGFRSC